MATPPPPPPNNIATVDDQSWSPRRRRPSPSPVRLRGFIGRRDQSATPTRIVQEVSKQFPLLTKTNYDNWSTMMKMMLRAKGLWAAVKEGAADEVEDQMAMEALLRRVPLELAASLASKPSTKAAWDQLESSRLGFDRACMLSAQRVRRQYENIAFHDGESLDDFALRLAKMVHELEILDDLEEPRKVSAKYLRVVPKRFVSSLS
jgi:hypothetical protein